MNMIKTRHNNARLWSNYVLREVAPMFTGDVINVSAWKDKDKQGNTYRSYFASARKYYISNIEGERGISNDLKSDYCIDLLSTLPDDLIGRFDVVFNHTTLEHVFDVRKAFQNLCLLSKDIVIVVVPFAQNLHYEDCYGDFWRLTPFSLRALYLENGFEIIFESANSDPNTVIYLLFIGSRKPEYWKDKMPPWNKIVKLGDWIGQIERNPSNKMMKIKRWLHNISGL
jgi:hypothetical protein